MAIARAKHPAPFRTRQLSAEALMVLRLKAWESKSPPNLIKPKVYLSIRSKLTKLLDFCTEISFLDYLDLPSKDLLFTDGF